MILKKLLIGMLVGFMFMVQGLFGLTINSSVTLSGTYNEDVTITTGGQAVVGSDVIITGSLLMGAGSLTLADSYVLQINGDLHQNYSTLYTENGTMVVDGNYSINLYGILSMVDADANVTVNGDFSMGSTYKGDNFLQAGTLTVKGDFNQTGRAESFNAQPNHKVVLSGDTAQQVSFSSPLSSGFGILEINNTSTEGVDLGEIRISKNLITTTSNINNLTLHTSPYAGDTTLANNIIIDSGLTLKSGELSCDSHSITINGDVNVQGLATRLHLDTSTFIINGDLNQTAGTLHIDDGTILIDGNYTITDSSYLEMPTATANVTVNGDFTMGSNYGNAYLFEQGTLTVKGDFTQSGHAESFNAQPNHKVVLSGDTAQQVSFSSPLSSGFGILEINNTSTEGVTFQTATDVNDILIATNCQTRLNLDNVTYGTLNLDDSCTPLSLLVSDTTNYFATDTGVIGERTYNSDGNYTGSITLANGTILAVAGTYSSEGDVLTLNRTSPAAATTIATYLGEDAGVTSFSVSFNGGNEFISYGYTTAQERDDAVAHAVLLTIVGTTRYYINTKGAIGERTYNGDGTYTGSIIFANGNTLPVITGTYEIIDDQVIIDRSTPTEEPIELTYLSTDAGVIHFDVLFRGEVFQSSSYATKEERDAAIPNDGINPALIMYLLN